MWMLAYTVNDNENSLNEDHYETHETEQEARDAYAMLVANRVEVMCAGVGPILDATEPHWIETDEEEDEEPEIIVPVMLPGGEQTQWNIKGEDDEEDVIRTAVDSGLRVAVDHNGFWVRNWPSHEESFGTLREAAEAFVDAMLTDTDDAPPPILCERCGSGWSQKTDTGEILCADCAHDHELGAPYRAQSND